MQPVYLTYYLSGQHLLIGVVGYIYPLLTFRFQTFAKDTKVEMKSSIFDRVGGETYSDTKSLLQCQPAPLIRSIYHVQLCWTVDSPD